MPLEPSGDNPYDKIATDAAGPEPAPPSPIHGEIGNLPHGTQAGFGLTKQFVAPVSVGRGLPAGFQVQAAPTANPYEAVANEAAGLPASGAFAGRPASGSSSNPYEAIADHAAGVRRPAPTPPTGPVPLVMRGLNSPPRIPATVKVEDAPGLAEKTRQANISRMKLAPGVGQEIRDQFDPAAKAQRELQEQWAQSQSNAVGRSSGGLQSMNLEMQRQANETSDMGQKAAEWGQRANDAYVAPAIKGAILGEGATILDKATGGAISKSLPGQLVTGASRGLAGMVNPASMAGFAAGAVTHPLDTLKGIGQSAGKTVGLIPSKDAADWAENAVGTVALAFGLEHGIGKGIDIVRAREGAPTPVPVTANVPPETAPANPRSSTPSAPANDLTTAMQNLGFHPEQVAGIRAALNPVLEQAQRQGISIPDVITATAHQIDPSGKLLQEYAKPFYSKLEQVVTDKVPNNATADQVRATLVGNGVKPEEMSVTGVNQFLDNSTGPVPKSDLLDHIRDHQVQLSDVWKTKSSPGPGFDNPGTTKYGQYTLPGGSNYRELLLTLPEKGAPKPTTEGVAARQAIFDQYVPRLNELDQKARDFSLSPEERESVRGQRDAMESELYQKADEAYKLPEKPQQTPYTSSHWSEPNILAHVRMDDRTVPNGEKILHVAEIQSDWGQAGRKNGFKPPESQLRALEARRAEIEAKGQDATPDEREEWASAMNALRPSRTDSQPPAMPFSKTWHELAMKRVLRHAAENGYDRVTWDTGATAADRFDLSKQVSGVQYDPTNGRLVAYDLNGGKAIDQTGVPPEDLVKYIGKEAAQKLIDTPLDPMHPLNGRPTHSLVGPDLKVGGEGQKGFYDKILPDFVNKYTKKFGGKVEPGTVDAGDYRVSRDSQAEPYRVQSATSPDIISRHPTAEAAWAETERLGQRPVHSLNLTPALKKSVLNEGQPLFQREMGRDELHPVEGGTKPISTGDAGPNVNGLQGRETPKSGPFRQVSYPSLEQRVAVERGVANTKGVTSDALNQTSKAGDVKGFYDRANKIIGLVNGKADVSTVVHEIGHFFHDVLLQHPDYAETILKHYGDMSDVEGAERFAKGFEGYLRDGKAPVKSLQTVFAAMKDWMKQVYARWRGEALPPDVKAIFDKVYSHDSPETQRLVAEFDRLSKTTSEGFYTPSGKTPANILDQVGGDDPRLDPFEDTYDPKLVTAMYRQYVGGEPEFDDHGVLSTQDAKYLNDAIAKRDHSGAEGDTEHLKEAQAALRQTLKEADQFAYRMRETPNGTWAGFGKVNMYRTDGLPAWLRKSLNDYAVANASDQRYVDPKAYMAWIEAGKPGDFPQGMMTAAEWPLKEGDPLHSNASIPGPIIEKYLKDVSASLGEAERTAAAKSLGITEQELQDAVDFHTRAGTADSADGEGRANAVAPGSDAGDRGSEETPAPKANVVEPSVTEPVEPESPPGNVRRATIGPEVTGLARQFEDPERIARGQEPLPPQGARIVDLFARGKDLVDSGKIEVTDTLKKLHGRIPTDDEFSAMQYQKARLFNESEQLGAEILDGVDPARALTIDKRQEAIAQELDQLSAAAANYRGAWHKAGMNLQVAMNVKDYSLAGLKSRAREAVLGEDPSPSAKSTIEKQASTIAQLTKDLEAERKKTVNNLGRSVLEPVALKNKDAVLARIRKLTSEQAAKGLLVGSGGPRGKQAGYVDLGALLPNDAATLARDLRALVRHYVSEGTSGGDAIMKRLNADLPHLSEENILDLMSGKYKGIRIARTAAQLHADQVLGQMRQAAVQRQKGTINLIVKSAYQTFNGLTRNLKLAIHASAPFMQGRKVLAVDPAAWLKSWPEMIKGYKGGDDFLNHQMARFMNDPLWDRAQAAGLDKVFAKPHGTMTEMDDYFMKNLDLSSKLPIFNKVTEHSGAAFNGFLNEARWQMFKNVAKVAPHDPAFLKAMADEIGVLTGRSTSKLAKTSAPLGQALFSPRYTVSKWEYATGKPLIEAARVSPEARNLIAKRYAKVAVGYTVAALAAAKIFNGKVDLDPRSADFGHLKVGNNLIDVFAQEGEPMKLIAQTLIGRISEGGKGSGPSGETLYRYARNKTTPLVKAVLPDIPAGAYNAQGEHTKDMFGRGPKNAPPFDWTQQLKDLLEPITIQGVEENMRRGGGAAPLLNTVGITTRTMNPPSGKNPFSGVGSKGFGGMGKF